MSLTLPVAQWTVTADGAVQLRQVWFYLDGSTWKATTDYADTAAHTTAYLEGTSVGIQLNDALTSGMSTVVTPGSRVLALS